MKSGFKALSQYQGLTFSTYQTLLRGVISTDLPPCPYFFFTEFQFADKKAPFLYIGDIPTSLKTELKAFKNSDIFSYGTCDVEPSGDGGNTMVHLLHEIGKGSKSSCLTALNRELLMKVGGTGDFVQSIAEPSSDLDESESQEEESQGSDDDAETNKHLQQYAAQMARLAKELNQTPNHTQRQMKVQMIERLLAAYDKALPQGGTRPDNETKFIDKVRGELLENSLSPEDQVLFAKVKRLQMLNEQYKASDDDNAKGQMAKQMQSLMKELDAVYGIS